MYADKNFNKAHCLIHLSRSQFNRYRESSIYLSDINIATNHWLYDNVIFGNKLKYNLKKVNTNQGYIWSRVIALDQMKGGMIAILANVNIVFEQVNKGTVF